MADGTAHGDARRWPRIAVVAGLVGLVIGLLIGAGGCGSGTKTVTEQVTETTTVPVEHVTTVTKIRRVVRTKTVTIQAQSGSQSSGGGSGSSGSASDGSQYAGMTCAEIGHSFTVTPGSDPEHDRDGDGIACEAYP